MSLSITICSEKGVTHCELGEDGTAVGGDLDRLMFEAYLELECRTSLPRYSTTVRDMIGDVYALGITSLLLLS